ncbi:uncharacterized protein LOC106181164 isoform X2 [Lingula anatina]|uniref:Uncharacterized protein LOC106181164 isoform X2 n=1 Tax=Lingula anatina TaxID=7574 RepID=A0A1S3KEJ5_LINAN|nr:uncharacterized protein LOC106181164 isoform X2 [Lingula anatina]|eukprot:XP_013420922.1 uncharacterized protein LOC106181164 isoform X2 [Lingula anatina]
MAARKRSKRDDTASDLEAALILSSLATAGRNTDRNFTNNVNGIQSAENGFQTRPNALVQGSESSNITCGTSAATPPSATSPDKSTTRRSSRAGRGRHSRSTEDFEITAAPSKKPRGGGSGGKRGAGRGRRTSKTNTASNGTMLISNQPPVGPSVLSALELRLGPRPAAPKQQSLTEGGVKSPDHPHTVDSAVSSPASNPSSVDTAIISSIGSETSGRGPPSFTTNIRLPPKKRRFIAENAETDASQMKVAQSSPEKTPLSSASVSIPAVTTAPSLQPAIYNTAAGAAVMAVDPQQSLIMLAECQMALRKDEDGDLPLHIAVVQEEAEAVEKLIQLMKMSNVSVDVYNKLRQTPLHLAVITQQWQLVVKLLQHGATTALPNRHGQNAFHLAAKRPPNDCLKILLRQSDIQSEINARDYEGHTPVHVAVTHNNFEAVELLLAHGADVDAMDGKSGKTALFHAAENNQYQMVKKLLDLGCSVNLQNYSGTTALQATSGRGHMDVVMLLIRYGADTSVRSSKEDGIFSSTKDRKSRETSRSTTPDMLSQRPSPARPSQPPTPTESPKPGTATTVSSSVPSIPDTACPTDSNQTNVGIKESKKKLSIPATGAAVSVSTPETTSTTDPHTSATQATVVPSVNETLATDSTSVPASKDSSQPDADSSTTPRSSVPHSNKPETSQVKTSASGNAKFSKVSESTLEKVLQKVHGDAKKTAATDTSDQKEFPDIKTKKEGDGAEKTAVSSPSSTASTPSVTQSPAGLVPMPPMMYPHMAGHLAGIPPRMMMYPYAGMPGLPGGMYHMRPGMGTSAVQPMVPFHGGMSSFPQTTTLPGSVSATSAVSRGVPGVVQSTAQSSPVTTSASPGAFHTTNSATIPRVSAQESGITTDPVGSTDKKLDIPSSLADSMRLSPITPTSADAAPPLYPTVLPHIVAEEEEAAVTVNKVSLCSAPPEVPITVEKYTSRKTAETSSFSPTSTPAKVQSVEHHQNTDQNRSEGQTPIQVPLKGDCSTAPTTTATDPATSSSPVKAFPKSMQSHPAYRQGYAIASAIASKNPELFRMMQPGMMNSRMAYSQALAAMSQGQVPAPPGNSTVPPGNSTHPQVSGNSGPPGVNQQVPGSVEMMVSQGCSTPMSQPQPGMIMEHHHSGARYLQPYPVSTSGSSTVVYSQVAPPYMHQFQGFHSGYYPFHQFMGNSQGDSQPKPKKRRARRKKEVELKGSSKSHNVEGEDTDDAPETLEMVKNETLSSPEHRKVDNTNDIQTSPVKVEIKEEITKPSPLRNDVPKDKATSCSIAESKLDQGQNCSEISKSASNSKTTEGSPIKMENKEMPDVSDYLTRDVEIQKTNRCDFSCQTDPILHTKNKISSKTGHVHNSNQIEENAAQILKSSGKDIPVKESSAGMKEVRQQDSRLNAKCVVELEPLLTSAGGFSASNGETFNLKTYSGVKSSHIPTTGASHSNSVEDYEKSAGDVYQDDMPMASPTSDACYDESLRQTIDDSEAPLLEKENCKELNMPAYEPTADRTRSPSPPVIDKFCDTPVKDFKHGPFDRVSDTSASASLLFLEEQPVLDMRRESSEVLSTKGVSNTGDVLSVRPHCVTPTGIERGLASSPPEDIRHTGDVRAQEEDKSAKASVFLQKFKALYDGHSRTINSPNRKQVNKNLPSLAPASDLLTSTETLHSGKSDEKCHDKNASKFLSGLKDIVHKINFSTKRAKTSVHQVSQDDSAVGNIRKIEHKQDEYLSD